MTRALMTLVALSMPLTALADPICHQHGNGTYKQIDVNPNALAAHFGHGDLQPVVLFADADLDGFGDRAEAIESCGPVDGYVANDDDLDDSDATVGDTACTDVTGAWTVSSVDHDGAVAFELELTGTTCAFSSGPVSGVGQGGALTVTGTFDGTLAVCPGTATSTVISFSCPDLNGGTSVTMTR